MNQLHQENRNAHQLAPADLRWRCDPSQFTFETTGDLASLDGLLGQARAESAIEFGLGMRLTLDKHGEYARELLPQVAEFVGESLVDELLKADQGSELGTREQRERVSTLKKRLQEIDDPRARDLMSLADVLVRKSVWIVGGDGWA